MARAPPHGVLERLDQARLISRPCDGSVGYDVEMRASAVRHIARPDLVEVADLSLDPNPSIAFSQQTLPDTDEVFIVRHRHRIRDQQLLSGKLAHHGLRGARGSVSMHECPAARAVELRCVGPEMLRVICDFGHRADGRATRSHRRLAVHCDSNGHRVELVDRRPRKPL